MFGRNPVASARDTEKSFNVHSIFYTIQGEGPYAGCPAVFVRLAGCNLRCHFCDTDFTSSSIHMSPSLLCNEINLAAPGCPLIVITGGEPMLQNIALFVTSVSAHLPYVTTIQIETAGTVWPKGLEAVLGGEPNVFIVVSPKTPKVHPMISRYAETWKYIVSAEEEQHDGFPAESTQIPGKRVDLARPPSDDDVCENGFEVCLQPMDEHDRIKNEANVSFVRNQCLHYGFRVSLQIHKLLGVE